MLNQLTKVLNKIGKKNYYFVPNFKAQFNYFCDVATPPILPNADAENIVRQKAKLIDNDNARFSMLPGNGNTGHNCSDLTVPVDLITGALIYQDIDPDLSARCYNTWIKGGRPVHHHYDTTGYLLSNIDEFTPIHDKVNTKSKVLAGSFVNMRGNMETDNEVYILVKNGLATHHNDYDESGFTIWAYGSPLCSDYGYHCDDGDNKNIGGAPTWMHNCVEFDGKSSGYYGTEITDSPELFISNDKADLLVSKVVIHNLRDSRNFWNYLDQRQPCHEIEYKRYFLFVKPDYLIVYDNIISSPYAHRWWLHCQSKNANIEGNKVIFNGKFDVDLTAEFITPKNPKLEVHNFSVQQYVNPIQEYNKDWRVFLEPHRHGQSKKFEIKSEMNDRVVIVKCKDYTDTIMLANTKFDYNNVSAQVMVTRKYNDGKEEILIKL